ncbi:TPA: hypothetical protein QDB10_002169 [Burkholderia vietnamiensis]|nr:hypothetical protein [Burkholderia vietnamiensis]
MGTLKCGCVIADAQNTSSVRTGHELGGYVKSWCTKHGGQKDVHARIDDALRPYANPSIMALWGRLSTDAQKRTSPENVADVLTAIGTPFAMSADVKLTLEMFMSTYRCKGWEGDVAYERAQAILEGMDKS